MNRQSLTPVTRDKIIEYQRNGVVMLKGVFDKNWLELIDDGIRANMAHPTDRMRQYGSGKDADQFFYDAHKIRDIPQFERFGLESPMAEIAGRMMMAKCAIAFYFTVFVRSPGCQTRTPWHRDQTGWCADGNGLSIWVSLDPVPRSSTLEFVPGSHLWPGNFRRTRFDASGLGTARHVAGMEDALPMPDLFGADRDKYPIVGWDMDPGDCLVFHTRTLHGGAGDLPPGLGRRTISTQWLSEECRVVERPGGADPNWVEDLRKYGIGLGDSPASEMCPVVWSEAA